MNINLEEYLSNHKVILFDGVCRLCNGWARFLIENDTKKKFKLAMVQSAEGQAILAHFNFPLDTFDTMVVVDNGRLLTHSAAFINVTKQLSLPYKIVAISWIIPAPVRDFLYTKIAINRYQLFGRYDDCLVPTPDHDARFLKF